MLKNASTATKAFVFVAPLRFPRDTFLFPLPPDFSLVVRCRATQTQRKQTAAKATVVNKKIWFFSKNFSRAYRSITLQYLLSTPKIQGFSFLFMQWCNQNIIFFCTNIYIYIYFRHLIWLKESWPMLRASLVVVARIPHIVIWIIFRAAVRGRLWSWPREPVTSAPTSHYSSSVRFFIRVSHITFFQQMQKNSFLVPVKCVRKNYKRVKKVCDKWKSVL